MERFILLTKIKNLSQMCSGKQKKRMIEMEFQLIYTVQTMKDTIAIG